MLGSTWRYDFLLNRGLVLNKFDIRDLRQRPRWNQEKEGQDEASEKQSEVSQIRTACGFRHFQNIFGIDLPTL